MNGHRIPALTATTPAAAKSWFRRMVECGLLFHPDDDPKEIICISDGTMLFTSRECTQLREYLDRLFAALGDTVYDLALDAVSAEFHTRGERRAIKAANG